MFTPFSLSSCSAKAAQAHSQSLFTVFGLLTVLLLAVLSGPLSAQPGWTLEIPENDPLETRIYTYPNGLTLYISPHHQEPRVYTTLAIRAGSTYDPADKTGLAHYLEHLLFKGTSRYGTSNWQAEKPLLEKIERLYTRHESETDSAKRRALYRQIDSLSLAASQYALFNEYDRMVAELGAKGTNAYTSQEITAYINDLPAHELGRWLQLEAERFRDPVLRGFHTELEVVYEEKNRGLDSDRRQVYETLNRLLYPNHPYGSQTTIGSIEHLKNPSIARIHEYFQQWYVPHNMAVILAGDLTRPDSIATLVGQTLGQLPSHPVQHPDFAPEAPLQEIRRDTVLGPEENRLRMAWRVPGVNHPDYPALLVLERLLSNGVAGLLDLNLEQRLLVQNANAYLYDNLDHSALVLSATPKPTQSLPELEALLVQEVEKLKDGQFSQAQLRGVLRELEMDYARTLESNRSRAYLLSQIYKNRWPVEEYNRIRQQISNLSKAQLTEAANRLLGPHYAVVYKLEGERTDLRTIAKPPISPLNLNDSLRSDFFQELMQVETTPPEPDFFDYDTDLDRLPVNDVVEVLARENTTNNLFNLTYILEFGKPADPELALAIRYLDYLGTDNLSAEELRIQLYELGCKFFVYAGDNEVYVQLTGLDETMEQSLALFEHWITHAQPDPEALQDYLAKVKKGRADAKKNKYYLRFMLENYALYGPRNPYNTNIPTAQLDTLQAARLARRAGSLLRYPHRALYYGPRAAGQVAELIRANRQDQAPPLPNPPQPQVDYTQLTTPRVLVAHTPMRQVGLNWYTPGPRFQPALQPEMRFYGKYLGGGMSSVIFQKIREEKALGYAASGGVATADHPNGRFEFSATVYTQADKMQDAMAAMEDIFSNLPLSELRLQTIREELRNTLRTSRPQGVSALFNYLYNQRLGNTTNPNKRLYEALPTLDLDDIRRVHQRHMQVSPKTLAVLGDPDKIDLEALRQYGPLQVLDLDELLGFE